MSTNSMRVMAGAAMLFSTALMGGCIVSDQLTTITIHPDGSADLTRFQANIHSNETGAKAEEELRRFVADFDAGHDPDLLRIEESGGKVIESRWVHQEVPVSTLVVAHLPDVAALEKSCTLKGEQGETLVEGRFTQDGRRRRLSLKLTVREVQRSSPVNATAADARQAMANGISETRIAVTQGTIVQACGFTVADDKQSALLAPEEIDGLVRAAHGRVELYLEWEVAAD